MAQILLGIGYSFRQVTCIFFFFWVNPVLVYLVLGFFFTSLTHSWVWHKWPHLLKRRVWNMHVVDETKKCIDLIGVAWIIASQSFFFFFTLMLLLVLDTRYKRGKKKNPVFHCENKKWTLHEGVLRKNTEEQMAMLVVKALLEYDLV